MRSLLFACSVSLSFLFCTAAFGAGVSFSGTFYGYPAGSSGGVVAADFNRDGLPDFAVAGTQDNTGISVFLATSPGKFGARTAYPVSAQSPDQPIAADLNGDGTLDLIVLDWYNPKLAILWNQGDGSFKSGPTVTLSNPATSLGLGDLNRDGKLDIAATQCFVPNATPCSLTIFLGNGSGGFKLLQNIDMTGNAGRIHVADIDGDSKLDVVLSRTDQVLVFWGRGNGTVAAPTYLSPPSKELVTGVAVGDFNNSGRLDVVAATFAGCGSGCYTGHSYSYKNMGGRTLSLAYSSNTGFAALRRIDLNGDLNQDLVYLNGDHYNGFFVGLLGKGNGTFQTTLQSLPNPDDVADTYVRDLDLDSRDDYLASSWSAGGALVALQTGGYKNCAPPSSAKLAAKICAPVTGSGTGSPVLVRASGNSPAGVIQLQVWIDGMKRAVKWHDQLANRFTLSSGRHRIAVVATDRYIGTTTAAVYVTVP